jgi:hypothetical protein
VNVEVLGLGPPQHGDGSLGGKSCKRNPAALISARRDYIDQTFGEPRGDCGYRSRYPELPRTDIMAAEVEVMGGRGDSCRGDMSTPVRCFGHRPAR